MRMVSYWIDKRCVWGNPADTILVTAVLFINAITAVDHPFHTSGFGLHLLLNNLLINISLHDRNPILFVLEIRFI